MKVIREGDELFYSIKNKVYLSSGILHFKAFSLDGITGVYVIKYVAHNLGITLDSQNYTFNIYSDSGIEYEFIRMVYCLYRF